MFVIILNSKVSCVLCVLGIFKQQTFAFWQDETWLLMLEKEQDLGYIWTVCSKAVPEPHPKRC